MLLTYNAETYTPKNVLDPEAIMTRVKAGFSWAQSNYPDRLARVDADILRIASGINCVGGQMFTDEGFWLGFLEATGLTESQPCELGFNAGFKGWGDTRENWTKSEKLWREEAAALTEAWQQLLRGEVASDG